MKLIHSKSKGKGLGRVENEAELESVFNAIELEFHNERHKAVDAKGGNSATKAAKPTPPPAARRR